jgi:Ca2+-binding EF-hand superfamily protein
LELNEIEDVFINLSSEMLLEEPSADEIEEIIKCMDINGDGKLTY